MEDIKVGVKTTPGLAPHVVYTGSLKEEPILVKSKIPGMEEKLSNLNKSDLVKKEKKIEIDLFMFHKILGACAEDLSAKRKININNKEEILSLLINFDPRNQIFNFSKDIDFVNKAFGLKLNDLADFLSNFLFTNINTYSLNLFNAIPEILPIVSIEARPNNTVIVSIHN